MRKPSSFSEQRGYFSIVQNSGTTDYLSLALLQAKSIKATQKINRYAIAVDEQTKSLITDDHLKYFDYVVDIPWGDDSQDLEWKLANEWKVWWMSPFKETVKLDCDILFTRDVSHWWDIMCTREVCISTRIYDYRGDVPGNRKYRKLVDDNNLLDAYSGFTYFRYGNDSAKFYTYVKQIFKNWEVYRDHVLTNCRSDQPTTDEVYAIAALLLGEEKCYIPGSHMGFTHMKGAINGLSNDADWTEYLISQLDGTKMMIGLHSQMYPVHYVTKSFGVEVLNEY